LKSALGTASSDFVNASLFQLISAARLPGSGISEIAVNAALAFIEGAKLMRAYATQVEALRRLRNGGSQFVRVEHVHVNEGGGQAVIGNVKSTRE
jgi:hypothetical protein